MRPPHVGPFGTAWASLPPQRQAEHRDPRGWRGGADRSAGGFYASICPTGTSDPPFAEGLTIPRLVGETLIEFNS